MGIGCDAAVVIEAPRGLHFHSMGPKAYEEKMYRRCLVVDEGEDIGTRPKASRGRRLRLFTTRHEPRRPPQLHHSSRWRSFRESDTEAGVRLDAVAVNADVSAKRKLE